MPSSRKTFFLHQFFSLSFAGLSAFSIWKFSFLYELAPFDKLFHLSKLCCGVNFCGEGERVGPFFLQYFFLMFLWCYVIFCQIFQVWIYKKLPVKKHPSWLPGLIGILFFSVGIESALQIKCWRQSGWLNPIGDVQARYKQEYPKIYAYAQIVKHGLPKQYSQARLISDVDFESDMLTQRALSYFLYPINIRFQSPGRETNTLLFFYKKNARAHVPPGYSILIYLDEENMVAIQK